MSTEEKFNQAKGSVKEGLGKLTGDKKTEKEGAAEKVVSKVKEVAVKVSFLFLLDFFLAKKFFNFLVVNACKN